MIYAGLTQEEIDATIQAAAKDFYDMLFQHLTAKNAAAKNPASTKLLQAVNPPPADNFVPAQ